ncbi:nucleotidyltransferase family protein [Mangrovivirga cuniculi]|uniref:Nucleotidyltransferase family protein n=1 Tax=Mangrovivirga cuniculi TaxID=2715131 RepID=A0A4D7K810_9BACT|nr:nucleotidyltransferase family protein [Mangrovivirga cuniculi]QCK15458.1 nucleotidyltransferase family protein [Mangrovivirga cuniculi]
MIKNNKIGVVILAAGSSSRLGHPKQLVQFQGKTLLQLAIDKSESFDFDTKIVVLGAEADNIKNEIDEKNFTILLNENWKEGIASSIRKGVVESIEKEPALSHILFLLSDQPFISKSLISKLVEVQLNQKGNATYSSYENEPGVPAIFQKKCFLKL